MKYTRFKKYYIVDTASGYVIYDARNFRYAKQNGELPNDNGESVKYFFVRTSKPFTPAMSMQECISLCGANTIKNGVKFTLST